MRAVHWVRTRQEESELSYWLSFVAYEQRDNSLNNRIYLLYLIIFFSVWLFVTLTLFASAGSELLGLVNKVDPVRAATFLEIVLLGVWSVINFWLSVRRSPVIFSEQDEVLICQMPVNRRHVTSRWMFMPWLKSAVPFWLAAIVLGFSVANITIPWATGGDYILEYAWYGLRAWLVMIPIHLAIFSLQWLVGVVRLQKDYNRHWLAWLVIPGTIIFYSLLLTFSLNTNPSSLQLLVNPVKAFIDPLQAGFIAESISSSLRSGWLFAFTAFGMMIYCSGTFNLSRAAQETRELEKIEAAHRYGFSSYAKQLQDQRRMGVRHAPSRLPALAGAGTFIWKDVLQSQRLFSLSSLLIWFRVFLPMLGLSLLPDLGSRALVIGFWVIQMGQISVIRLRSDLSHWSLIRQIPIPPKKILLFDLVPAYLLSILISFAGMMMGSFLFKRPMDDLAILLPGIAASIAGMAAFDVIRRARSSLMITGYVPEVSAGGILLGLVTAAVPLLINNFSPGLISLSLAMLSSLGLGVLAFHLALRRYQNIDAS